MMSDLVRLGSTPDSSPIDLPISTLTSVHSLIQGKTGSGKSMWLAHILGELVAAQGKSIPKDRGKVRYEQKGSSPPRIAFVVIDLGGDAFLFNYLARKCKEAGIRFRFLSLDDDDASSYFAPFQSIRKLGRNVARWGNFVAGGLGFIHGAAYGQAYFTKLNTTLIIQAVQNIESRGEEVNVVTLGEELKRMAKSAWRGKDAAEALYGVEQLLHYPHLMASDDNEANIDIERALEDGEFLYFYLPSLLEPLTSRSVAALVLWSVIVEAVWRKKRGLSRRSVICGIDEFPTIIGGKNVEMVLTQSRKFDVNLALINQTNSQLKFPDGDLAPIVTDNTSLRLYFSPLSQTDIELITNHSKSVVRTRKSTTAKGLGSSITLQENEVPAFEANDCKSISGLFGHAVLIQELGTGHADPIHLVCAPPVSKEEYDRLSEMPLPRRTEVARDGQAASSTPLVDINSDECRARVVSLQSLLAAKREALHGWRKHMSSDS